MKFFLNSGYPIPRKYIGICYDYLRESMELCKFQVRRNLRRPRWSRGAVRRPARKSTRPTTRAAMFVRSATAPTPPTTTWCGTWGTSAGCLPASHATSADASSGARTTSSATSPASTVCSTSPSMASNPTSNLYNPCKLTGSLYPPLPLYPPHIPQFFFPLWLIINFVFFSNLSYSYGVWTVS